MTTERRIKGLLRGGEIHWVGDGFRVSNYFPSGNSLGDALSPFLLMDYHPPYLYPPTESAHRGVGTHPHRGFETVTLAFEGSVAHHDSAGNGGVIGPGDAQWMTAASGILHQEYHEPAFARAGGTMHMMQLWVNLPRAHKMAPPRYQGLTAAQMGRVELPEGGGHVRVVAGEFEGVRGPAATVTPITLLDARLSAGGRFVLTRPGRENLAVMVLDGEVTLNGESRARPQELALFENEDGAVTVEASTGAHVLVLGGEPIDEPVVHYGPFVMTSEAEIMQAIRDYNAGRFGALAD